MTKKERGRKYYLAHKEEILEKTKKYFQKNRKRMSAWRKQYGIEYCRLHPWLSTYKLARGRCLNKNNNAYHKYGAKGIKFLMTSADFKFLWLRDKAYLMEEPSIDRMNSEGNYELSNCRYIEKKLNSLLGRIKFIERSSHPIIQNSLTGKVIGLFPSVMDASRKTNICQPNIHKCLHNQRHTAGGYKWQYANKEK
jgi:hypothetical protein